MQVFLDLRGARPCRTPGKSWATASGARRRCPLSYRSSESRPHHAAGSQNSQRPAEENRKKNGEEYEGMRASGFAPFVLMHVGGVKINPHHIGFAVINLVNSDKQNISPKKVLFHDQSPLQPPEKKYGISPHMSTIINLESNNSRHKSPRTVTLT